MDELAKRFAELADKYGQNVVDAALGAVRIEIWSSLVCSLLWAFTALTAVLVGRYFWNLKTKDDFDQPFPRIAGGLLFVAAFFFTCSVIWTWIDPWTWTALSHPELYLAKRVFKL